MSGFVDKNCVAVFRSSKASNYSNDSFDVVVCCKGSPIEAQQF